jgi:ubiquitin carboxyl-terminal hydrolase 22/27/51
VTVCAPCQRFEHKSADKSSARKIDVPIRFPASLNMAPYTTVVMNMREKETERENGAPFFSWVLVTCVGAAL